MRRIISFYQKLGKIPLQVYFPKKDEKKSTDFHTTRLEHSNAADYLLLAKAWRDSPRGIFLKKRKKKSVFCFFNKTSKLVFIGRVVKSSCNTLLSYTILYCFLSSLVIIFLFLFIASYFERIHQSYSLSYVCITDKTFYQFKI